MARSTFGLRPEPEPGPRHCRAAAATVLEWPEAAHGRWRERSPPTGADDRRRGARHRLRLLGSGLRRHPAGGAPPRLRRSARRAGRGRPHRPCRFRDSSPQAARAGGARRHGPATQGDFLRRARHRGPRRGAEARGRRRRRPRTSTRALARLDRRRPGRHGRAVQGVLPSPIPRLAAAARPCRARCRPHRQIGHVSSKRPSSSSHPGIRHAFFTRRGGVSEGIYARSTAGSARRRSGAGAREPAPHGGGARLSRRRRSSACTGAFARTRSSSRAPGRRERPRADGMVTRAPGPRARRSPPRIAARCCSPIPRPASIGACPCRLARRARPACSRRRVAAMERLGARRERIDRGARADDRPERLRGRPGIRRRSSATPNAGHARFFEPASAPGHAMFDLPGYIGARLAAAGVGEFADLGLCTYSDEERFLQLPPRHPPRRAGLRPADLGDRAHAVSAIAPPLPSRPRRRAPAFPRPMRPGGCGRRRVPRNKRGERGARLLPREPAASREEAGWEGRHRRPAGSDAPRARRFWSLAPRLRRQPALEENPAGFGALSASARTRVFHRDGRGRRQDAGRRALSRRRPGGGEP